MQPRCARTGAQPGPSTAATSCHAVPCRAVQTHPTRMGKERGRAARCAAQPQPRVRCTRAAAQRARRRCWPVDRRRHAVSGAHRIGSIARVSLLLGATGDREGVRKLGGARLRRAVVLGRLPLRPIAIRPVPTSVRSRLGPFPLRRGVPLVLHRLLQRRKLGRRERFQDRDDRQPAQHQRAVPAYTRMCARA